MFPLFPLGQIVATPGALAALERAQQPPACFLARHAIGADVFAGYLIDLDLPGMRLKLSPLPKRPEDNRAPTSLNSEGEEQANAEQKENTETEPGSNEQKSSVPMPKPANRLPRDR